MRDNGWRRVTYVGVVILCGLGLIVLTVAVDNLPPRGWLSPVVAIVLEHLLVIPICLLSWASWRRYHGGNRDARVVAVLLVVIYLMLVGGFAEKLYLRAILPPGVWELRQAP